MLALEQSKQGHQWMSVGDAGREDVTLEMDPSVPDSRPFPTSSFITFARLRKVVAEWAYGEMFPPPSAKWRKAEDQEVAWL